MFPFHLETPRILYYNTGYCLLPRKWPGESVKWAPLLDSGWCSRYPTHWFPNISILSKFPEPFPETSGWFWTFLLFSRVWQIHCFLSAVGTRLLCRSCLFSLPFLPLTPYLPRTTSVISCLLLRWFLVFTLWLLRLCPVDPLTHLLMPILKKHPYS